MLLNGKYKIERVLGQGGFGITYLAKQKVSVAGSLGTIDAEIEVTIKEFFMKELLCVVKLHLRILTVFVLKNRSIFPMVRVGTTTKHEE